MNEILRALAVAATAVALTCPLAFAQERSLPERSSPRPETTSGVPHTQIGVEIDADLAQLLLERVAQFPGVTLGPTRISLPGAIGFQLDPDMLLSRPNSIVGGFEFAHMHTDGSLHASLDPAMARMAIEAGWAVEHPWANQRPGWSGFVMIYTPTTPEELDVVIDLVESSYSFITGKILG
ncbi:MULTISPECIES: luciferase family protein [unclassified Ruegeria]|uniref:luciferase domain-containing protein n=1 Tax=unclassified Ruegeria TaxID=2625375 RepID=UPI00209CC6BB|nr:MULTISPECIES: luciferase family protein [unclassified Ruegeria]